MAEGRFSFPHTILLTSCIILLTCLLQQIVIQFDYSISKCEAFVLDCVSYATHASRWMMDDGRWMMCYEMEDG